MPLLSTEGTNSLTLEIDTAPSNERVRLINLVDREMYGAFNDKVRSDFVTLATKIRGFFYYRNKIIAHGAGTSGRFSKHWANRCNEFTIPDYIFYGIQAGSYPALVVSVEGAEDDVAQGAKDFKKAAGNAEKAFYLSISCSGGAKCNLGALEQAALDPRAERFALLFNNIEDLDNVKIIPGLGKTTRQIYQGFREHELILNPILGPEAIAWSTRMKGGTATQLILDTAFCLATMPRLESIKDFRKTLDLFLKGYENSANAVGAVIDDLAEVVERVTESLSNKGHIYYLGSGEYGKLGILDASECNPTFGARHEDVRGFIEGGWQKFITPEQFAEFSLTGKKFIYDNPLGLEYFNALQLSENDIVVFLGETKLSKNLKNSYSVAYEKGAKTIEMIINPEKEQEFGVYPSISSNMFFDYHWYKLNAMKLLLNTITTASYAPLKAYGNKMIDLRLKNDKLISRGIRIIQEIIQDPILSKQDIIAQFDYATRMAGKTSYGEVDHLIPSALLKLKGIGYELGVRYLNEDPVVRRVIKKYCK